LPRLCEKNSRQSNFPPRRNPTLVRTSLTKAKDKMQYNFIVVRISRPLLSSAGHSFLLICLLMLADHSKVAAEQDSREVQERLCHDIAIDFLANRQRLGDFVWEFTRSVGLVDSLEDARQLKFRESYSMEGVWAIRNGTVKFELLCPSENMERPRPDEKPEPGAWISVGCGSDRILHDGIHLLSVSTGLRGANIGPDTERLPVHTPFSIGIMGAGEEFSPGNLILAALAGEGSVVHLGQVSRQGRTVDVVELLQRFDDKEMGSFVDARRMFLDRSQGSLPLEIELSGSDYVDGKSVSMKDLSPYFAAFMTEIGQTTNGCWYPMVGFNIAVDGDAPYTINVYRTRSLRLGAPTDVEMSLSIPAGYQISDRRNGRTAFRLRKDRNVAVTQLTDLLEECQRAKKRSELRSGSRQQEPVNNEQSGPRVFWYLLTCGLLISAGIAIFYRVYK